MKQRIKNIYNTFYKDNIIVNRFAKVFSVDVIVRSANFLLLPVFLFLMSKEDVGSYNYYYSMVFSLSFIFNLGLYVGLTKLFHDYSGAKEKGELVFTINICLLSFMVFVFLFFLLTKFDIDLSILLKFNNYSQYRLYIFIALFAMVFNNLLAQYFITSEKIRNLQLYNISRMFAVNIIVISILYLSDSDKVITRLLLTYITELIVLIIFYIFCIKNMYFKFNFEMMQRALKIGLPLMIGAIFSAFINFGDKYFVEKFCGDANNAVYTTAIQYSTILLVVTTSFQSIWMPLFMKEKDLKILKRKTNKNAKLLAIIFTFISLLILVVLKIALVLNLIPISYSEIINIMIISLPAYILVMLVGLYGNYFVYFEKTHTITAVGIITSVLSIPLYYFFIKNWGYYGAAFTLLIINFITFLFYYYRSRYYINNRIN